MLPANKYREADWLTAPARIAELGHPPSGFPGMDMHVASCRLRALNDPNECRSGCLRLRDEAHALERIAELEKICDSIHETAGVYLNDLRALRQRIAELEAEIEVGLSREVETTIALNEALGRLLQYEPYVDSDLVLAREIAGALYRKWGILAVAQKIEAGEDDDNGYVQCALAGIKAVRAGGGL